MMKQDFRKDFFEILRMVVEADSMALSRYADGEANILKNSTIGNKDGWLYKKDKNLIFRADLRKTLKCADPAYLYGISCTCCDKENHDFLLSQLKTTRGNLTYSNIFVNSNFPLFKEHFFKTLLTSKKDIVICTNKKAKMRKLEEVIPVKDFIPIPGNCINYWEKNRDYIRALLDLKGSFYNNAIFLFAAGPLSEILIHELWLVNSHNIMLDIGSSLDPILFKRKSRNYHFDNSEFSQKICTW